MAVNPESIASWGLLGGAGDGGEEGPTQILAEPVQIALQTESLTVELEDDE
jgi:hypothetical protein